MTAEEREDVEINESIDRSIGALKEANELNNNIAHNNNNIVHNINTNANRMVELEAERRNRTRSASKRKLEKHGDDEESDDDENKKPRASTASRPPLPSRSTKKARRAPAPSTPKNPPSGSNLSDRFANVASPVARAPSMPDTTTPVGGAASPGFPG